ncbi:hypothetical protein [Frankia sp. Cppng1_Ct_nod]|uniref:hypothetical protein n=1 Tax=Frankia sp. Cppng1_Ct_nod TaxID=2897162 RepID=UPI001041B7E4|nr:hypothetical protein [Frankia sp. Cppng1_Ct_nod]
MSYYKFLRPSGEGVFTGYDWVGSGGNWIDAGSPVSCQAGIHACRVEDLPYWLAEGLWRIDLAGQIVTYKNKVAASRGRLGARVEGWTTRTAREFSVACVGRVAQHAAAELRDTSMWSLAESVEAAVRVFVEDGDAVGLKLRALEGAAVPVHYRGSSANLLSAYITDALESLDAYPPAMLAYIAARAASQRRVSPSGDPYLDERRWQASWLATRLGLSDSP